jgi:hypothetical protein
MEPKTTLADGEKKAYFLKFDLLIERQVVASKNRVSIALMNKITNMSTFNMERMKCHSIFS